MFKNLQDAVKQCGSEDQMLKDAHAGMKQRLYRKDRNMKNQAIIEAVTGNEDVKKRVEALLAKKVG